MASGDGRIWAIVGAGVRAADEGMGEYDGARRRGPHRQVGAHPTHRLGQCGLVAAGLEPPRLTDVVGVEVGKAVDRHRAVGVVDHDGRADLVGAGADEDARCVDELRAEAQPLR